MSTKAKRIEIEFRSVFDENKYHEIDDFLKKKAEDLGNDDKDVFFFIMPDKLLKVVNNISKGNAKIIIKLNKIGKGSAFEEIEIPIAQQNVEHAVKMFTSLNITNNIMHSFQQRHNYLYKGVELALKQSDAWGYHLELEIMVDGLDKKMEAENTLRSIARELGVHIMTDKELTEFTRNAEADYHRNQKNSKR